MDVEIPPFLMETATQYGAGVPYALKVVAGRLADDPDLGHPSTLPGILTVLIEDDLIEDCPALSIGYLREPDRIEIRYVKPTTTPAEPAPEPEPTPADPATDALTARQIADAWHRITTWLRHNAPDSYAALRPGGTPDTGLGIRVPVELRALWLLTAGDDLGCLPGNLALLPLDAVTAEYRLRTETRARRDAQEPQDQITWWRPSWIPFATGHGDRTHGLYLDTETGFLGRWSRYGDGLADGELDTLVTYMEEIADMLEAPALATRDQPGLIGGRLVWRSGLDPAREGEWRPVRAANRP